MGRPPGTTLQIGNAATAQASALGELFLRKPSRQPVLPQQRAEIDRGVLTGQCPHKEPA
jgi:hypothetical protein